MGLVAGGTAGRTADSDNDFASANSLTSGVQVNGQVNTSDDPSDFYKIDLKAGQTMKVVLSFTCSTDEIYFSVWDPDQNDILDIQDGNTTRGDTILANSNGTHYVEVWTFFEAQDYALTVTVGNPSTLVPGTQVRSMLSFTGVERSEWYRIWLNGNISGKSEGVYVNMTEDLQTTNCNLFLWDVDVGIANPYNLSRGASPKETVSCAASFSGWYYLLANIWSGSGGYTLDVTKFQTASDGNNDFANATLVKHNAVVAGTVDQGWDKYDWFRYHVFAGDTFSARASRSAGTDLFNLSIYDSSRNLLAGNLNIQAGAITNSITINLPSAASEMSYYVVIYSYAAIRSNQYSDETGKESYSLAFTSTNHLPEVLSSFEDIILNEDEKATVDVASHFRDIDGDGLIFNVTGNTKIVPYTNTSSLKLELTPAADWSGKETVTVTADDGFGGKTSLTINLTVNPVNDIPFVKKKIADLKMLQGGVDVSIDLSKVFYDNDIPWGDRLNYTVENTGALKVVIGADGKVTITDPIEFYGSVSMQFTAADGEAASAVAPCNVSVQHVNQPPRVKTLPGNISMDEDTTATLDMSGVFSDLDGDPITLLTSGQTKITAIVDPNTLMATFRPAPNLSGFYEDIKFTAQDDKGFGEYFVVVRVTVVVVNDPPVIKSFSPTGEVTLTETEGEDFSVTVTTVEIWDTFNYTWYLDEKDLLWNENSYPLKTDYSSAGKHVLKVVVDDGWDSVSKSWNITVINKNRDPSEVKITSPKTGESFMQATEMEFSGSAKDLDGDEIAYSWLDGRTELSTDKSFSTKTLKPGSHTIVLEASDGTATARSKAITITITANTSPRILSLLPSTGEDFTTGKRIDFSVNARDAEDDPLVYQWSEAGRVLSTQPAFSSSDLKEGTHSVQVSIYDGFTYTNQTVVVEVIAPASAPALGGNTMLYMLAAVAAIAVIGAVAFMAMRRKKPKAPEAAPQPVDGAAAAAAMYGGQPQDYQAPPAPPAYDYGAYQPPAGEPAPADTGFSQPPADTYSDQSQYSAESGVSDEQPGVSGQQPAWASAPPRPPMPGDAATTEAPPSEPAPPAPEPPAPAAPEAAPSDQPPAEPEKKE
jgi:hypothetical protein